MTFPDRSSLRAPRSTPHTSPGTFLALATVVLLLAAVFRLVALHDVPPGLAQDEVLNADIVTFIRQGKQALFFREGYGHEPLYHYWSVPFQLLFGDNVLSIRLPAVYLGLLLVAATMRWARRDFSAVAALVTGVGLALSWWPIVFSRIGLRPILEPLLLVGVVWFWRHRPWLAGLFLGLSFYSYTGARVAFLIPLLFAASRFVLVPEPQVRKQQLKTAALVLVVGLVLYMPLFLTLQADPSLQERLRQLQGPLQALQQGDARPVLQSTLATLGVFSFTGDPRWTYMLPRRPLFDPVTSLLFYGGLLLVLFRLRQARYTLVLVWLGVGLLPSALSPQAPSTVRLVGAMPVVYLLPGLAAAWLWRLSSGRRLSVPERREGLITVNRLLITVLTAVLLFNIARTIGDGFVRWPAALETRLKYQSVLLDIGRDWRAHPTPRLVVADGFYEPIDNDSLRRNIGHDPAARWIQTGADVVGAVVFPVHDASFAPGRLYIPEYAPLSADLLAAAGVSPQPLYRSRIAPSFAVYALPSASAVPPVESPVTFEDRITFMGYEILPRQAEERLRLITYWRVEAPLPQDLATFVHLLSPQRAVVAQHDGLDAAPGTLQPGDTFIQGHVLPLPQTLAGGPYTLELGLYRRGDGRRLRREGQPADRLVLMRGLHFDGTRDNR